MASRLDEWLEAHDLGKYRAAFADQEIRFADLPHLTENDLLELGLPIGPRRRMLAAIAQLAERMVAPVARSHEPRQPELRQLTLMFADLVGSTRLSTELDIESYRDLLHDYQSICMKAVRDHHGHVAQFLGDGVVAYFGYPTAEEDDAERAVLAGLAICSAVRAMPDISGHRPDVRVGISTGDVVVDSRESFEALALGEAPNMAARVQGATAPGTVAVSDDTRALLGANFHCEWIGRHELKGFAAPIGIWVVRDAGRTELRFQARQRGNIKPMIGRDDELLLLERRWQTARRDGLQVVMLSGEAGIGKSRLVAALSERAARDDCLRLSFQCLPNHDSSAFFPVIALINHAARISRTDDPGQRLEKLKALLGRWTEDVEATLTVFARLLSIPLSAQPEQTSALPEQMKAQLLDTLVVLIRNMTREKPVVLLFEDLHWIDPSSEDLLDFLIENLSGAPVLIVGTFRPDYKPRWTGMARVTSLSLARLEDRHARRMLRNTIDDLRLPPDLEAQIISKTDGVPLFLEEMARMVGQRMASGPLDEAQDSALALPSTLKDLLRARIDHLTAPRDFVSTCAAIGRSVLPAMLEAVTGRSGQTVKSLLDQLVEAQILIPRRSGEELSFFFRHALVQDAIYELILPSRARALHRTIAETIVARFPEVAARAPEQLARHYARAGISAEARDAWRRAAELAAGQFATEETISHLRAALHENSAIADEVERDAEELVLRRLLNVALNTHAFGSKQVRENRDRLHQLLRTADTSAQDHFLELMVQYGTQLMLGETESAIQLCQDMDRIAHATGDPTMAAVSAHSCGMAYFMTGAFEEAVRHFDEALALRNDILPEDIFAIYAADIRSVDIAMRSWALALRLGEHDGLPAALAAIEEEPHDFSRCYALGVLAAAHQVVGDAEAAKRLSSMGLEISRQRKFQYWNAWCGILHGWAVACSDEPSAGIAEIEQGIDDYLATGSTQMTLYARTLLADAWRIAGDTEQGLKTIDAVRGDRLGNSIQYQAALTNRVEAELRHGIGLLGQSGHTGWDVPARD